MIIEQKKLIIKLTESIDEKESVGTNLRDLSDAWDDSRDSDEIIKEIRNSKVEKQNNIDF